MPGQAATARLELDASGFDKQANASFREFSKQLTSVKDATDVAMRGAEALQKVFVKSLGGTIAIGAANALGDAMRDVGNRIGSASDAVSMASAGMSGFSGSLEEAAVRAQTLSSASAEVTKTLGELSNANPIMSGIFKLFGGEKTLKDLEETTKGLAGLEVLSGLRQGNKSMQRLEKAGPAGQEAEQQRMADEKARRDLQSSAAFRGADSDTKAKIMQEFEKKLILQRSIKTQKDEAKAAEETQREQQALLKKLNDWKEELAKKNADAEASERKRAIQRGFESEDALKQMQDNLAKILSERAAKEKDAADSKAKAQQALAGDLLGSSRSGQQSIQVAERQRSRQVTNENFQFQDQAFSQIAAAAGGNLTATDMRNRVAAEQVARANPSMLDKANAAGLGMDAADYAGQKARYKASLGNAGQGLSSKEIDSQFRNKLQKDAALQKEGKQGQGDIYKLLSDVLNKLTSAPMVGVN